MITIGKTEKVQADLLAPATKAPVRMKMFRNGDGSGRPSYGKQFALVALLSVVLCSVANYCLAFWLGLPRSTPWKQADGLYRRIGPKTGPQIFCAGSSLLVWGLDWPKVSESLGEGAEDWTVAGSSPEVWEAFQRRDHSTNVTIVGLSVYDLNEMRLTPERAKYVPVAETVSDLWASGANSILSRRILTQYAMTYLRVLFPSAGDADKVLVGIRRKAAERLGMQATLDEHEGVLIERAGVLDAEDSTMNLGGWSSGRLLRRLAALRAENHDSHEFLSGPKWQALRRVLLRAQQQGRAIVVVLPVSQSYRDALLDNNTTSAFETALSDVMATAPKATLVRLDQVPGISNDSNFADLVHLGSSGKNLVTPLFLKAVDAQTPIRSLR